MGAGGVPNRTVVRVDGQRGDLPTICPKPNSRYDLYLDGKKVQSRWYDDKGMCILNRDYEHQDSHKNHRFPHDHKWKWVKGKPIRGKNDEPDFENFN